VELDTLIATATESRDWARAADLRLERLATWTTPRQKVRELVAIARILQAELNDSEAAIEALEQARAIAPDRVSVLQALRRGYETLNRWASALEVTGVLADLAASPTDRAALHFAQARIALEHLEDEHGALALLERVLEGDPSHAEAQAAIADARAALTPVRARPSEPTPVQEPAPALAAVPVPEPPSAVAEEPSDELDPARYAHAFAAHRLEGRPDAMFVAALALEELGAADVDQQALVEQLRSVSPLRARGTLGAEAWTLLRPSGSDELLSAVFGSVARAGVLARLDQLVARNRLVVLDPETRLDESSTASVVRTFQWAARVMGVPGLHLHSLDAVPGEIAAVRAHQPTTAVGPSIVSGRSAKDLAFLAGRHLTYYLPDHQALVYFPTLDELTHLLLAAVQLVKPRPPAPGEGGRAVVDLAELLDHHVDPGERAAILDAVERLEGRGGRFSLAAWTRHAELMATRAGLLLCGDLATAMAVVTGETRAIAGLTVEAKRRDLVSFCASPEHVELRLRWALPALESLAPPARSVAPPA
jgi:tetratricopeptide (TPR) repeat protein